MPQRVYFPNLNGVRFLAAALVFIHHTEQFHALFGLPSFWNAPQIRILGNAGVVLFFVLSGFLITFLLAEEQQATGRIDVPRFYMRRMLRIWPLYYVVVLASLFVLPGFDSLYVPLWSDALPLAFVPKTILMLAFLPNVAIVFYPQIPYAAQAWSVGVEEQFYLVWPWVMRLGGLRYRAPLAVLAFVAIARTLVTMFGSIDVMHLAESLSIECMALGALTALMYARSARALAMLFRRDVQCIAWLAIVAMLAAGFSLPHNLHAPVYGFFFAIVIVNLAGNPQTLIRLENRPFNYLGRISYGLYMYHPIAIVLTIRLIDLPRHTRSFALQYAAGAVLTIVFAALSYELFEKWFLKWKTRFAKIVSGDAAAAESF